MDSPRCLGETPRSASGSSTSSPPSSKDSSPRPAMRAGSQSSHESSRFGSRGHTPEPTLHVEHEASSTCYQSPSNSPDPGAAFTPVRLETPRSLAPAAASVRTARRTCPRPVTVSHGRSVMEPTWCLEEGGEEVPQTMAEQWLHDVGLGAVAQQGAKKHARPPRTPPPRDAREVLPSRPHHTTHTHTHTPYAPRPLPARSPSWGLTSPPRQMAWGSSPRVPPGSPAGPRGGRRAAGEDAASPGDTGGYLSKRSPGGRPVRHPPSLCPASPPLFLPTTAFSGAAGSKPGLGLGKRSR